MESKRLDNAALAAGISPSYINAHGKPQSIGAETKRRLLDAMHKATPVAKAAVTAVPNVKVFTSGKKMPLMIEGSGAFSWLLTTETGQLYKGDATGGKNLNLPAKLPEGYHTLTLTQDDQRWHCRVIVAPRRCYEPQALLEGKKLWGACVQLYTLRSASNWGIGDFGDLKAMLADVGERGGAFIGLNPIHALYPANPESASPYSPSSRRWLNDTGDLPVYKRVMFDNFQQIGAVLRPDELISPRL
jgi:4-alpha-glucanotransferase